MTNPTKNPNFDSVDTDDASIGGVTQHNRLHAEDTDTETILDLTVDLSGLPENVQKVVIHPSLRTDGNDVFIQLNGITSADYQYRNISNQTDSTGATEMQVAGGATTTREVSGTITATSDAVLATGRIAIISAMGVVTNLSDQVFAGGIDTTTNGDITSVRIFQTSGTGRGKIEVIPYSGVYE